MLAGLFVLGNSGNSQIIPSSMGIIIGYIVDTKTNIRALINADNFYEAEQEMSYYHEHRGISFQLPNYSLSGGKGWAPTILLIHLTSPNPATELFFDEQGWQEETAKSPRLLHLTSDLVAALWGTLRSLSLDVLHQKSLQFAEEIKSRKDIYRAWKIEYFTQIETEYLQLHTACLAETMARHAGLMERHEEILANHHQMIENHASGELDEATLHAEHEQMNAEHEAMIREHEAMAKEHQQINDDHEVMIKEHQAEVEVDQ